MEDHLHLSHPHHITGDTPVPPVQLPAPPAQPIVPPTQPIQPGPIPWLNWSDFKPEFPVKPDEDVKVHLLRTNDWMDIHGFPEGVKVQRFCLTIVGKVMLWYGSVRPIALDLNGLQNQFMQQHSKIGNIWEQLFHVWRSFHFDEKREMLDDYVTCIRQVAALFGYGEPQVLEVFENTLLTRLYWVLFPIEDLKLAVETAKRILTKGKIGKQLAGQSSLTLFMKIRDGYNSKKVFTFDTQDGLNDNIDKLTSMVSKLTAQNNNQFKPKIYQSIRRGRMRNYYDQGNYQNRYRSNSGDMRISSRGSAQYRQNYKGRSQYVNNYRNDFRRQNFRGMQTYRGPNFRGGYRGNYRNANFGRGRSRSRETQYSSNFRSNDGSSSSRSGSGLRFSSYRDRIKCFKCREDDLLAKDCPN